MLQRVCDECGKPATYSLALATGRVIIYGKDAGQCADLCNEHKPISDSAMPQPTNCKKVSFRWPSLEFIT